MRCRIIVVDGPSKRSPDDRVMWVVTVAVLVGLMVLFGMGFAGYRDRVAAQEAELTMAALDEEVRRSDEDIEEKLKVLCTLVPLAYPDGLPTMVVDDAIAELGWADLRRKKTALEAQWETWQALEGAELKAYWNAGREGLEMADPIWLELAKVLEEAGELETVVWVGERHAGCRNVLSDLEMVNLVNEMREVVRMRREAVEMRMRRLRMEPGFRVGAAGAD